MTNTQGVQVLEAFGAAVERAEGILVGLDGVIVLGDTASTPMDPRQEHSTDEPGIEGQEAGPTTGPGTGRRASSAEAASCAPAHTLRAITVGRGHVATALKDVVMMRDVESLVEFYPDVEVTASSARYLYLLLHANPFPESNVGFKILLEVPARLESRLWGYEDADSPLKWRTRTRVFHVRGNRVPPLVPTVRVWARWHGGPLHGLPVRSHHQQPDGSLCVCMRCDWLPGLHPLLDFVNMSVLWAAKVLHECWLGRYPGPQHCTALVRRLRDRPQEFCGCGERKQYADCHRREDFQRPLADLQRESDDTRQQYLNELVLECRPVAAPPDAWKCLTHSATQLP